MRISNRLKLLANEVEGFKTVCDVGCDHGLFSIYSILNKNIKHAYLLDINIEPLNSAKTNFNKYKLDNASFVLSDGLISFEEELDALVISGVGGYLITKILNDSLDKVRKANKIILQPNTDFEVLREFLLKNDFTITHEDIIIDNKKYCYFLTAINKKSNYTKEDIIYGPILKENINETYYNFWNNKYLTLKNEVNNIKEETKRNEMVETINDIYENIIKRYT